MNKEEYKNLVNRITPKEDKLKNAVISFLVGGLFGLIGEIFVMILINCYSFETKEAYMVLCMTIILISSFLTATGCFDDVISKFKMGLILPTSGFAHSITSASLDYKKDGIITLGSNFFKLAGSVILYGIVASFFFAILEVIIHG